LKIQTLLILFSNLNIAFPKILNFKILLHTHRFENVDRRRVLNMTAVRASASDLVLTVLMQNVFPAKTIFFKTLILLNLEAGRRHRHSKIC